MIIVCCKSEINLTNNTCSCISLLMVCLSLEKRAAQVYVQNVLQLAPASVMRTALIQFHRESWIDLNRVQPKREAPCCQSDNGYPAIFGDIFPNPAAASRPQLMVSSFRKKMTKLYSIVIYLLLSIAASETGLADAADAWKTPPTYEKEIHFLTGTEIIDIASFLRNKDAVTIYNDTTFWDRLEPGNSYRIQVKPGNYFVEIKGCTTTDPCEGTISTEHQD